MTQEFFELLTMANDGQLIRPTTEKQKMKSKIEKPTKSGVAAALASLGYLSSINDTPPALIATPIASAFTPDEMAFAKYLIYDTDFGGAWNDSDQINMHCV